MYKNLLRHDDQLPKAIGYFLDLRDGGDIEDYDGPCSKNCPSFYGLIDNHYKVEVSISFACFAGLGGSSSYWEDGVRFKDTKYIISSYQDLYYEVDQETADCYIHWLIDQSPWKDIFLYADSEVFVYDVNSPANLLVGGMIATRLVTENVGDMGAVPVNLWYRLVQEGVNPNLAYVLCHSILPRGDKFYFGEAASHTAIHAHNLCHTSLKNFTEASPQYIQDPWIKCISYCRIDTTWQRQEVPQKYLIPFLKSIPLNREEVVSLNIFVKDKTVEQSTFTFEELLELIPEIEKRAGITYV